jgi:hypothetical protein
VAVAKHVTPCSSKVFVTRPCDETSFFSGKMQKKDLNDIELKRIAGVLVSSASVSSSEIDKIACDPAMFDKVRARINAGETRTTASLTSFSFIRRNAAAVSGVLLISIAAISFGLLLRGKTTETAKETPIEKSVEVSRAVINRFPEPDNAVDPVSIQAEDRIAPQRASITTTRVEPRPRVRKVSPAGHSGGEFYAVSYAGDPTETERGGRIIRVDMSRSALFAMGVDIPLENEAEVVKADLLVGNDGVTRAIRVVK